jgi:hypothetical protein
MLSLTSDDQPVHLSPGTSVQLEYNSPLFDEEVVLGAYSYSFSVPATPNGALYGYPERPDAAQPAGREREATLRLDDELLLAGRQRVRSASAAKYAVALSGALSGAGLSERPLASFAYGGPVAVPRWVEVTPASTNGPAELAPGLTLHANQVVARPEQYGYVFAPLRNDYQAPAGSQPTVNRWLVSAQAYQGMPAGGCFAYDVNWYVPGNSGELVVLPPMCAFPKLRYVLACICQESGLAVDAARLLPGELGDLVLVSNAFLVDRGDEQTYRFHLADVVPALSVAELLAALRQDWGIVLYQDPVTTLLRTAYLRELVAAPAVEWSGRWAGAPEVTLADDAGVTLTYGVDPEDELTKEALSQQPDPSRLLPPVATVAELPVTADVLTQNPRSGQVRLVLDEDTYYVCTATVTGILDVALTWKRLVPRLSTVAVNGGGEELPQRQCFTVALPSLITSGATTTARLPAIAVAPFQADAEKSVRSAALRLLFYNGRQPPSDGVSTYPQLASESRSGAYSTRLTGEAGTYAQWLRTWLPLKLAGTGYKQPLRLTAAELAGFDLTRKLRLDGVEYLVRKLAATVPLRKPAALELVRV